MEIDHDVCYRALLARDTRFDGLFFVGVKTTGIYCRPVCTARTPGRDRCRFFTSAALAEKEGFRPCLRCRPELAPGQAPIDAVRTVARVAASRIEAGELNNGGGIDQLADDLGLSSRQLRRAMRQEFGVSPVELAQTKRLLLAKQLLAETDLPIIRVAFASGFASVRRFNNLFRAHYRLTPSTMRRSARGSTADDRLRLRLDYRPPYAWRPLLRFLAGRATAGVECVSGNAYLRTVSIGRDRGWIRVEPEPGRNALSVEVATELVPVLPAILARLRNLFDLDARPNVIAADLRGDPRLARIVKRAPGMRVPGAMDGFELAVRAILGQRVSVKGATTLAGRLAAAFGEPIDAPLACLNRIAPTAERLAQARPSELTNLGIAPPRAESVLALARAVAAHEIDLWPGLDPEGVARRLAELPGIGAWTAGYIAMRALRWPDAFADGDLGLLKAAGLKSPRALRDASQAWRPWRAYAAMYLWESLHSVDKESINGKAHAI
ncbi:MAG: helix-turn-helix domain-containing protein [Planctomycetia bacterium]|nr:helix-turn-helix domain-containing protein [Planctomycetia bacterium]